MNSDNVLPPSGHRDSGLGGNSWDYHSNKVGGGCNSCGIVHGGTCGKRKKMRKNKSNRKKGGTKKKKYSQTRKNRNL